MCRLLGYASRQAEPVERSFGHNEFTEFTSLAELHADGWGMAWQDPAGGFGVEKSADRATRDPAYARLSESALGRAGLVHLRWATDGLEVGDDNTHPFSDGAVVLAHNGSISPIPELERLLRPEFAARLVGTTDSERYFQYVRQCIHDASGDVDLGIVAAVTSLHAAFPQSSLNAIVLAPDRLVAIHVNATASGPIDDIRALYPTEASAPHGHLDRYFTMSILADDDHVRVVSSGVRGAGWEPLSENTIVIVDTATLERRTIPVSCGHDLRQTPVS